MHVHGHVLGCFEASERAQIMNFAALQMRTCRCRHMIKHLAFNSSSERSNLCQCRLRRMTCKHIG